MIKPPTLPLSSLLPTSTLTKKSLWLSSLIFLPVSLLTLSGCSSNPDVPASLEPPLIKPYGQLHKPSSSYKPSPLRSVPIVPSEPKLQTVKPLLQSEAIPEDKVASVLNVPLLNFDDRPIIQEQWQILDEKSIVQESNNDVDQVLWIELKDGWQIIEAITQRSRKNVYLGFVKKTGKQAFSGHQIKIPETIDRIIIKVSNRRSEREYIVIQPL